MGEDTTVSLGCGAWIAVIMILFALWGIADALKARPCTPSTQTEKVPA